MGEDRDGDDDGWVGFEGFEGCGEMWGEDFEGYRYVGEREKRWDKMHALITYLIMTLNILLFF